MHSSILRIALHSGELLDRRNSKNQMTTSSSSYDNRCHLHNNVSHSTEVVAPYYVDL